MQDRSLVEAMVAGDPRGLDDAYRRYAPRLVAYCTGLLHDPDSAADVVHDTFLIAAERVSQLREPDRLCPWLYAIARHQCLRHLRARDRQVPLSFDIAAGIAAPTDTITPAESADVVEVVRSAAAGLSDGDREMIDLALRHALSVVDIGAVLALPANHVHARLSRARGHLSEAVGALLLARSPSCPALASSLAGWDGRLDPLTRKRINRHVASCSLCSRRREDLVNPLLSGYAALPFLVTSPFVSAGSAPPVPFDPSTGFPVPEPDSPAPSGGEPRPPRPSRSRWPHGVFTAILATGVLFAGLAVALARCGADPPLPPTTEARTSPGPVSSIRAGAAASPSSAGPQPLESPAPSSGPSSVPSSAPSSAPSPVPPAAFAVAVVDKSATCTIASGTFKLYVKATATRPIASARLYWIENGGPRHSLPLEPVDARTAEVTKVLLRYTTVWWVHAVAADGTEADTPQLDARNPCV